MSVFKRVPRSITPMNSTVEYLSLAMEEHHMRRGTGLKLSN